jgi:hypothetical protein
MRIGTDLLASRGDGGQPSMKADRPLTVLTGQIAFADE